MGYKDCNHTPKKGTVTKKVLSEVFECKGFICKDCGAQLWNEETQTKYNKWLHEKLKNPAFRDKMKIQKIGLQPNVNDLILKWSNDFHITKSKVIQGIITLYVVSIQHDQEKAALIDRVKIQENRPFPIGSVKLSPIVFFELQTLANMFFDGSLRACAEEIVNRVVVSVADLPEVSKDLKVALIA
jgi:hypothetical protein